MDSAEPQVVRDQLLVRRQRHQDAIVKLDVQIQATDDFIAVLASLGTQDPDLAVSPASAPTDPSPKTTRRKAVDHPAVKALRYGDLRPYRPCLTIKQLAVAYARRHEGVIHMSELVPLAVRLGLSKAVLYKNAWGAVFKTLSRDPHFSACEDGRIVVDEALLRPRSDEAP